MLLDFTAGVTKQPIAISSNENEDNTKENLKDQEYIR